MRYIFSAGKKVSNCLLSSLADSKSSPKGFSKITLPKEASFTAFNPLAITPKNFGATAR